MGEVRNSTYDHGSEAIGYRHIEILHGNDSEESLLSLGEAAERIAKYFWLRTDTYGIFDPPTEATVVSSNIAKLVRIMKNPLHAAQPVEQDGESQDEGPVRLYLIGSKRPKPKLVGHPDLSDDQLQAIHRAPKEVIKKAHTVGAQRPLLPGITRSRRETILATYATNSGIWKMPELQAQVKQRLLGLGDPIIYLAKQVEMRKPDAVSIQELAVGQKTLDLFIFGTGEKRLRDAIGFTVLKHAESTKQEQSVADNQD